MRWPAAQLARSDRALVSQAGVSRRTSPRRPRLLAFAAAELVLAMAIPFLAIEGYHTLLGSRSGTFIDEPGPSDPGWTALVSATPIVGVAEVHDGMVSGLALIVPASTVGRSDTAGGTVVLVPGNTSVSTPDGSVELSRLEPAVAVRTLAQSMRISLSSAELLDDETWSQVLDGTVYELDNPDPVPGAGRGSVLAFAVGSVTVGASNAAVFAGRPVDGGSLSTLSLRRRLLWEAMVAEPPTGGHRLAESLRHLSVDGGGRVIAAPTEDRSTDNGSSGPVLTPEAAEELVRTTVAFPSGERLKIRVVDRTGSADLEAVAAAVAGRGIEVVEIANAAQFDGGTTELIVPAELSVGRDQLEDLAGEWGLEPIIDYDLSAAEATLLIGTDYVGEDGS